MKLKQMAKKNSAGEWVCRKCGEVIGEGHHAKVLAHYNLKHLHSSGSGGGSSSSGSGSGGCEHRNLRPLRETDGEDGAGENALKAGYKLFCPDCESVFREESEVQ